MRRDDLLTLSEAAALLGYANKRPSASVANLIRRGRLPWVLLADGPPRKQGGPRRVWRRDVLALRAQLAGHAEQRLSRDRARLRRLAGPDAA